MAVKTVKIELPNGDRVYTVTLTLTGCGVINHRITDRKLKLRIKKFVTVISGDVNEIKNVVEDIEGLTLTVWGREVKIRRPVDIPDVQS